MGTQVGQLGIISDILSSIIQRFKNDKENGWAKTLKNGQKLQNSKTLYSDEYIASIAISLKLLGKLY